MKEFRITVTQTTQYQPHVLFTPTNGARHQNQRSQRMVRRCRKPKAEEACRKQGWQCSPRGTKLVADIYTVFKDHRKRDCHNHCKSELDSLEGIVYDNDYDVLPRYIDTEVDKENPMEATLLFGVLIRRKMDGNTKEAVQRSAL